MAPVIPLVRDEEPVAEVIARAAAHGCVLAQDGRSIAVLPLPLPPGWRPVVFAERRAQ
jgi:hypothetical protein